MAKKKKHPPAKAAVVKAPEAKPVFSSPFKDLKKMLADRARTKPPDSRPIVTAAATPTRALAAKAGAAAANTALPTASPSASPNSAEPRPLDDEAVLLDDEAILQQALAGVRPLNGAGRVRMPLEPRLGHTIIDEDAEVIAQLSDLVSGQAPFDISETDEYVEGRRVGLDPRLVSQLRRGEFAVQAHLDLHGMVQSDAKLALKDFIITSVRKGLRTVLVVHGRGLGSPGGRAILKHACAAWLSHGAIGAHVLAFTSARLADGGAGATYVMLRRDRRRAPFDILQGAKRS